MGIRLFLARNGPAIITVTLMVGSWVLLTELVQGLQVGFKKPWFITFTIRSSFSSLLILFACLRWWRTGEICCCGGTTRARIAARRRAVAAGQVEPSKVVSRTQMTIVAALLAPLGGFSGYAWYLSLPNTIAALNNSIYQSASAIVFLFSVLLVGEAVTAQKLLAVAVSVAGVITVSMAPSQKSDDPGIVPTFGGYMWVIVSVVTYALYQVLYSRFTEQRIARAADICDRSFVSEHARAERTALAAAATGDSTAPLAVGGAVLVPRRSSLTAMTAAAPHASGVTVAPSGRIARARTSSVERALLSSTSQQDSESAPPAPAAAGHAELSADSSIFAAGGSLTGEAPASSSLAGTGVLLAGAANETVADDKVALIVQPLATGASPALHQDSVEAVAALAPLPDARALSTLYQAEVSAYMLGLIGLVLLLTMWPVFFLLDKTGVEAFEWPDAEHTRKLALSCLLDATFNCSLLFGILVMSALWTSVGTILVVPGTMLADWILHGEVVCGQAAGGVVAILAGFVVLQAPLSFNTLLTRICLAVAAPCRRLIRPASSPQPEPASAASA